VTRAVAAGLANRIPHTGARAPALNGCPNEPADVTLKALIRAARVFRPAVPDESGKPRN
jgi:hypothetical protein